jgi:hypothetical protein
MIAIGILIVNLVHNCVMCIYVNKLDVVQCINSVIFISDPAKKKCRKFEIRTAGILPTIVLFYCGTGVCFPFHEP